MGARRLADVPGGGSAGPRAGLSLVEVLVALAVLGAAGAALAGLQLGALRTGRVAQERQLAAALLADELLVQRLVATAGAGACATGALPPGWACSAERACHAAYPACALTLVTVTVTPPTGAPLVGRTAVRAASAVGP